ATTPPVLPTRGASSSGKIRRQRGDTSTPMCSFADEQCDSTGRGHICVRWRDRALIESESRQQSAALVSRPGAARGSAVTDRAAALPRAFAASPLRPAYAVWALLALAGMTAVILWGSLWLLNFVHVLAGGLWTGIDLFMGFVVGPILRRLPLEAR